MRPLRSWDFRLLFLVSVLIATTLLQPMTAAARPYFRVRPFTKIEVGAAFKIGTPHDNLGASITTPFIWHDSADGNWLIKGVDWNLLNIGYTKPTTNHPGLGLFGSSVDLDEPIKATLRRAFRLIPGYRKPGAYEAIKSALAQVEPGKKKLYLSAGPMLAIDVRRSANPKDWRGSLVFNLVLSRRFGGDK